MVYELYLSKWKNQVNTCIRRNILISLLNCIGHSPVLDGRWHLLKITAHFPLQKMEWVVWGPLGMTLVKQPVYSRHFTDLTVWTGHPLTTHSELCWLMRINFAWDKLRVQDITTCSFVTVRMGCKSQISVTNDKTRQRKRARQRKACSSTDLGGSRILLYFLRQRGPEKQNGQTMTKPQTASLLRIQMSKYCNLVSSFMRVVYFILTIKVLSKKYPLTFQNGNFNRLAIFTLSAFMDSLS